MRMVLARGCGDFVLRPDMDKARVSCCWHSASLNARRFGPVPFHRQALAPAEPAEVPGEDILDLLQIFLVSGLDAQSEPVRDGLNRALSPRVELDDAAGFRPLGLYLHLAARHRLASGMDAGPVAAGAGHRGCVLAELDEV